MWPNLRAVCPQCGAPLDEAIDAPCLSCDELRRWPARKHILCVIVTTFRKPSPESPFIKSLIVFALVGVLIALCLPSVVPDHTLRNRLRKSCVQSQPALPQTRRAVEPDPIRPHLGGPIR